MNSSDGVEHGIETTLWDNIGNGWRFHCLCGYLTSPSPALHESAEEIEDHWYINGFSK